MEQMKSCRVCVTVRVQRYFMHERVGGGKEVTRMCFKSQLVGFFWKEVMQ